MAFDLDLFVIGAGSGGVRAARMAAATGAKVAIAEEKYLGGTCVNVGCVPKKLMVYASHFSEDFDDATGFGWQSAKPAFDFSTLIENKNREIERLNGIYQRLLETAGVKIYAARARIQDEHTVVIGEETLTAEKILVCTGGKPVKPDIPGKEFVITSDEVFYLDDLPKRMVIVGGGYIACEFASIFNGFGCQVDLVYRGAQLLKHFDHGVGRFVIDAMQQKGIRVHFNTEVLEVTSGQASGLDVLLGNGSTLAADKVLYAIGRSPNLEGVIPDALQVDRNENGSLSVDERFMTNIPSIFALGDVIGTPELTPVALAQGMTFVNQQFGDDTRVMDYDAIPTAIFSQPTLGTVGLSEEAVKSRGIRADVFVSEFKHLKHTLTENPERVMMKIIAEPESGRVLGMHMAGPDAGEIIQGFAVAVKARLTKQALDQTIGIHPTAAEEFVTMRERQYSI